MTIRVTAPEAGGKHDRPCRAGKPGGKKAAACSQASVRDFVHSRGRRSRLCVQMRLLAGLLTCSDFNVPAGFCLCSRVKQHINNSFAVSSTFSVFTLKYSNMP